MRRAWTIAPLHGPRETCRAIMNSAWASIPEAPLRQLSTKDFEQRTAGEEIWTASEAGSEIVGFVSIWRADAFVHYLFVAPAHQGRGAGAALLAFAIDSLGGRVSLKCSDFNRDARRFYDRMGGRPTQTGSDAFGTWTRLEFGGL